MGNDKELKPMMEEEEERVSGGVSRENIVKKVNTEGLNIKIDPRHLNIVAYGAPIPSKLPNIKGLPKKFDDKKDTTNSLIPEPSDTKGMDSK